MTMLIEFRGDYFIDPAKWYRFDLDNERDRETFESIDFMMVAAHLYPGERIEIRCIKRED